MHTPSAPTLPEDNIPPQNVSPETFAAAHRLQRMLDLSILAGEIGPEQIRAIRQVMNLTQTQFAEMFHLPPDTLIHWENGRRRPSRTAQALIRIIAYNPIMAAAALNGRKSTFSQLISKQMDIKKPPPAKK